MPEIKPEIRNGYIYLNEVEEQKVPETVEQKPFEVTLGDGTVVKAPNVEEAFKIVAKMKEDTAAALRQEKERATQYQNEAQQYAAQFAETQRKQQVAASNGFDKQHYYDLLNNDPLAAQDYVDAYRYDLPVEQVRSRFVTVGQNVDNLVQQSVTASFLAQHTNDYPWEDAAAAKAMRGRMEQLIGNGLPMTVDTMNYAYTQLISEGSVTPRVVTKDETPEAPPSLSGPGTSISDSEAQKAENMSDKELAALLKSKGMLI